MIKTNFRILMAILITLALLVNNVLAIPGIPNAFYGAVTWNGQPAPDGTTIKAKINGVQVASTTTSGGKYGYPLGCKTPEKPNSFCVDDPNNDRTGKTINFFVNDVDTGQTAVFQNGQFTPLDLTATGQATVTTVPIQNQGGGGGGGFTTTTTKITTTTAPVTQTTVQGCQEKWVCTEWSTCKDDIQTRTCNDENKCGTNNKEPFTSQPCSSTDKTGGIAGLPFTWFPFSITGFVTLITTPIGIGLTAIIIISIVILIFLFKKRTSTK